MPLIHKVTALPVLLLLALPLSACQKNTETAPETTDSQDIAPITDPTDNTAAAHDDHSHSDDAHDHDHDSEHDEHAGHDHDHHHDTVAMTTYSCQPEQTIKVHYDTVTANSTPRGAHLLIDDIEYELTPMLTTLAAGVANAVVYETDIGINDDAGMYWQVNGNQATLVNKTLDGKTLPEDEETLFTCEQTAS
ncbi:hypothetical protein PSAR109036_09645 [Psychrobacter arenosus]|uniref:hypothetical protein n=1 Tax=Psychrobacter arenosus TaxID=256326 RepID=UPI00191AB870|nr:hypothetical protein [Psychrobacter arenosus]